MAKPRAPIGLGRRATVAGGAGVLSMAVGHGHHDFSLIRNLAAGEQLPWNLNDNTQRPHSPGPHQVLAIIPTPWGHYEPDPKHASASADDGSSAPQELSARVAADGHAPSSRSALSVSVAKPPFAPTLPFLASSA